MEFKYTSSIYISEEDLEEMVNRVKHGEELNNFYYVIMTRYDNYDYNNCNLIKDKVRKEIERRIN